MVYRVDRNNFYKNEKRSEVFTPSSVSNFLYNLVKDKIDKNKIILDPCVGEGSLLTPFQDNEFKVKGIDVKDYGFKNTLIKNYFMVDSEELKNVGLVICNPPFNFKKLMKNYVVRYTGGRPLVPELFLQHTLDLLGMKIPIILFTPVGFRLNCNFSSKRRKKFLLGQYPEIKSIVSLPKDVYEDILFHTEVLIFNMEGLKAHYFYHP